MGVAALLAVFQFESFTDSEGRYISGGAKRRARQDAELERTGMYSQRALSAARDLPPHHRTLWDGDVQLIDMQTDTLALY